MKETLENLSKTTFRPEFRERFEELDRPIQSAIATAIEELASEYLTQPWHHPQVKYIPSQGRIWRLKVGDQGEPVDHRVLFDVDDKGLIFLSVMHRDNAYHT